MMAPLRPYFLVGAAALLVVYLVLRWRTKKPLPPGTRIPPGPPGQPLIGNLPQLPLKHSWFKFHELVKEYGPIVRLDIAGQEHVILGTEKVANDLLRERGTIYSDRSQPIAVTQLLCDGLFLLFLPYGEIWRQARRFMHQVCMAPAAATYETDQAIEAVRLVRDLIREPEEYAGLFERFSVGMGTRLIYGQRLGSAHDRECRTILDMVHELERVGSPGSYLVDIIPAMNYIPDFLAPFKRYLKRRQREDEAFFVEMAERARRDMIRGKKTRSWVRTWLESKEKWGLDDRTAIYMFGSVFEAAATSTSSAMMSFVLAMVRHPGWFEKIQEEIDRVVGPNRLPDFSDIPQLPLMRACFKETMRYYPVTPGGFPHRLTRDDVYNGYFLKAGTTVHPVQWAIHRDPELYPDPESFNPNRWLDPTFPTYKEPLSVYPNLTGFTAFGSGRRICQGIAIAERSGYIQVSTLAWGCNINKAKDAAGNEITPPFYDYAAGFNVAPNNFPFSLTSRSEEKEELLENSYRQGLKDDPLL